MLVKRRDPLEDTHSSPPVEVTSKTQCIIIDLLFICRIGD